MIDWLVFRLGEMNRNIKRFERGLKEEQTVLQLNHRKYNLAKERGAREFCISILKKYGDML